MVLYEQFHFLWCGTNLLYRYLLDVLSSFQISGCENEKHKKKIGHFQGFNVKLSGFFVTLT